MKGSGERRGAAVAAVAALALVLLSGCANPGPPQPPSLKLPEIVSGLTASRVGDEVRLQWTTPSRTTDKLLITGPIVAEICRTTPAVAALLPTGAKPGAQMQTLCSPVVVRVKVTPGTSQAVDTLAAELTSAPARLLAYRVQLRNAAGRTAGASPAVYAASGPAPQAVDELRGRATKAGVVLEWKAAAQGTVNREQGTQGAESIELVRNVVQSPTATAASTTATTTTASSGSASKNGLPGAKEPSESRFRAGGAVDVGGTVDRTAQIGHAYRYTAQRVRSVQLAGQRLEVRSLLSAEVTVAMLDVFPPDAPVGLVAAPGFAGGPTTGQNAGPATDEQAQRPAIDLSWEPEMEPRIAGYRVYRRDLESGAPNAWRLLDTEVVPEAAYRDLGVTAGQRYAYRVTAVSDAGKESAPCEEVVETAAAR